MLDVVRSQAVGLDRFIDRIVNRVLRRKPEDLPEGRRASCPKPVSP